MAWISGARYTASERCLLADDVGLVVRFILQNETSSQDEQTNNYTVLEQRGKAKPANNNKNYSKR